MRLSREWRGRKPYREPVRTIEELADTLGVPAGTLRAHLCRERDAPKKQPEVKKAYYIEREVVIWWKEFRQRIQNLADSK